MPPLSFFLVISVDTHYCVNYNPSQAVTRIKSNEVYLMDYGVLAAISDLFHQIEAFNAAVSRKLSIAISQLEQAKSIEEYQQIGILVRDTLIEFGQSIYNKNMLVEGMPVPSTTDAKKND